MARASVLPRACAYAHAALSLLAGGCLSCAHPQNNFTLSHEAASELFHLRTLMTNWIIDFGCTFAQLAARPGVAEKWRAHVHHGERAGTPRRQWKSEAQEAVDLLCSREFADQPVRFICEAQMLMANVYETRKKMHEVR